MLSRYSLPDARFSRISSEAPPAHEQPRNDLGHAAVAAAKGQERLAARLAGSSAIPNAGWVTSMTGNLRPWAVVANMTVRLSRPGVGTA
jgi:hypothetical protein